MVQETIHIVVNPAAGHGKAPELINQYVVPILNHLAVPCKVQKTTRAAHEREIAQSIYYEAVQTQPQIEEDGEGVKRIPVLIGGGDGTAHEFVQGVLEAQAGAQAAAGGNVNWELIVVPAGSGNALFSSLFPPGTPASPAIQAVLSKLPLSLSELFTEEVIYQLSSLFSYLSKAIPALPLPLTRTSLLPSLPSYANSPADIKAQIDAPAITSHIVLSTSLHAAILHTSDELRERYPGVERFKIAAQRNVTSLFHARMKLYPRATGSHDSGSADSAHANQRATASGPRRPVEQYDPKTGQWVQPFTAYPDARSKVEWDEQAGVWALEGPFAYLVSTATVDRFESNFVISPLTSLRPRKDTAQAQAQDSQVQGSEIEPTSSVLIAESGVDNDHNNDDGYPSTDSDESNSHSDPYIYLTILRPLRDPLIKSTPAAKRGSVWSKRAFQVIGQAYQGGKHVNLTLPPQPISDATTTAAPSIAELIARRKQERATEKQGQADGRTGEVRNAGGESEDGVKDDDESRFRLDERGEGAVVVESFRVGGFDWIPYPSLPSASAETEQPTSSSSSNNNEDTKAEEQGPFTIGDAKLICADGAIYHLPEGGVAQVRLDVDVGVGVDIDGNVEFRSKSDGVSRPDSRTREREARFFVYA
ncbi:hypothetical protein I316_02633 [Kwoniella heveanensis BCC8398]|uniref:DAGKc domain-containing protein n=1 Tax=Kwoniella heveanensis BCC8398 TaxID=1296120 RepID=A0A1B9GX15_9TREE|nr:hypothetical protein I316_02633 [Kwoniella heveanensis BCC8398]